MYVNSGQKLEGKHMMQVIKRDSIDKVELK